MKIKNILHTGSSQETLNLTFPYLMKKAQDQKSKAQILAPLLTGHVAYLQQVSEELYLINGS